MENERWAKLEVWKTADDLAFEIYQITKRFPKEEIYGITSQIRRSALSIPTNIVEGYSRKGDKELASIASHKFCPGFWQFKIGTRKMHLSSLG